MNKAYQRINGGKGWEDFPSDNTAVDAYNLNHMEVGIDEVDSRVVNQDTTKFNVSEAQTLVKDVELDEDSGILTIKRYNGVVKSYSSLLGKIAINFSFNRETQKIILYQADGTPEEIDLSAFITEYEFVDSETIAISTGEDGKVTAVVKKGSITEEYLQPNFLADIKLESAKAKSSAESAADSAEKAESAFLFSMSYAQGMSGIRTGEDTDNAKYYSEQAKASAEQANEVVSQGTVTSVNGQTGDVDITPENIGASSYDKTAFAAGETILGWANSQAGNASKGIVQTYFPEDAPVQLEGIAELIVFVGGRKIIRFTAYSTRVCYVRPIFNGNWLTGWKNISDGGIAASATKADSLQSVSSGGTSYPNTYLIKSKYGGEDDRRFYLTCDNNNSADTNKYEVGVDFAKKATRDGNGNIIADTYLPKSGGRITGEVVNESYTVYEISGGANFRTGLTNPVTFVSNLNTGYGGQTICDALLCMSNIDIGTMFYLARGGGAMHDFRTFTSAGGLLGYTQIYDGKVISPNGFQTQHGDYAENWEYLDGNPDNEDRVGLFVTFVGKKIRISQKGDNLLKVGVVSATPSILGDSDGIEWTQKYQKDIYGREIWKDVEYEDENSGETMIVKERVLNPGYDETKKYIPRADRQEWDAVGTHGKIVVRDDGTCEPDGFCVPTDGGIATAAEEGVYVMERLDERYIRIYMR